MKKLFWAFLMLWPMLANAQVDICKALEIREPRNPFLRPRMAQNADLDTAQVLVIPIVFHVVHKGEAIGEGTNISDEQIQSCVTALNEDFRKIEGTNGDGLGVDTKIEFCLASRTPNNEPTTGIIRHDGSDLTYEVTFSGQYQFVSYLEDGVTSAGQFTSNLQGIPASYMKQTLGCWDTEKYLNMWIVSEIDGNNGGGGIQGFSWVGYNSTPCSAGPVQLFNVTGTTGNIKLGNLNKTTTHEIGHAFNLYHTFLGSCTETNCETQGDQVCDTPPTTANYGCTPSSCPDAQVNNYMDYTSQTCRNTFTNGQAVRMRDELWSEFNGFTTSLGCIPVTDSDGGISGIGLQSPNCKTTFPVSITIANYGIQPLSYPTIQLTNGISTSTSTIPIVLNAGDTFSTSLEFTSIISTTLTASVSFIESDDYLANNNAEIDFVLQGGNTILVEVSPDVWSNEIDWVLQDSQGEVILEDGNFPVFSQDSTFTKEGCLFGDCYTFVMTDNNGDGMCSIEFDNDGICDAFYDAFVKISVNDEVIFELSSAEEIDFGSILEFQFCDEVVECQGDLDADNHVGVSDFLFMLSNMGCLTSESDCFGDLDGNGTTDIADLSLVLQNYGTSCPSVVTIQSDESIEAAIELETKNEEISFGYYDLLGRNVGNDKGVLRRGIYILVTSDDGEIVKSKVFVQ
jgi:hypothetical protein